MNDFYIGVDLGQSSDFTAVTVIETIEPKIVSSTQSTKSYCVSEWQGIYHYDTYEHRTFELADGSKVTKDIPLTYAVRHLDRWRGVPYHQTISQIEAVVKRTPKGKLVIDRTGVGRPIYDQLTQSGLQPTGITIHGGDKTIEENWEYSIPKRDLIGAAQVALESGQLKIASGLQHAQTLVKELQNFRYKILPSGHDVYSAWREGAHDDLLLSLTLAVWMANRETGGMARTDVLINFHTTERRLAFL